jgi:ferritin-like protein
MMEASAPSPSKGIFDSASLEAREHVVEFLHKAYWKEELGPAEQTDIVHVIRGVIKAETGAIEHYTRIVAETEGVDPVTQDMTIAILRDEQGHRRLFEGFLREYEFEGIA